MAAPRVKRVKPLQAHNDQQCDCYDDSIEVAKKKCIYRVFPDGWSFVSDAGKGQVRGEVFTPRFIVDKMIVDSGMLPAEAVYENKFDVFTEEDTLKYISQTIVEPALGTANYSSSIIWYKFQLASAYVTKFAQGSEAEKLRRYTELLLTALSSNYAFDIDPGNLETSTQRILGRSKVSLNSKNSNDKWVKILTDNLKDATGHEDAIATTVASSLNEAFTHWDKMIVADGVLQQCYGQHTGATVPAAVLKECQKIMAENFKLFNGIVEEDTLKDDFVTPGWSDVVWKWWSFSVSDAMKISSTFELVPLREQIMQGKIEQLEEKMSKFKAENFVLSEDGLFATEDWVSKEAEREYKAMEKQLAKLK